ncbi:MAG: hypothetical protein COA75_14865 [Cellvibrionales bacterium]|nr:MAG: hypothetical protein COA75_14865 [Cellvibrionales bacterium]
MKVELDNKFSELNRRIKITSKARYNASRRLTLKDSLSQTTLALLSVALILISLVSISDIKVNFDVNYINIMQIVFAVLILTYSLLLSAGDYSARSVKTHRCGMELGRLARKVKPLENIDEPNDSKYEEYTNEYYNCLEKYENHGDVDYLVAYYSSRNWYGNEEIKATTGCLKFIPLADSFIEKLKTKLFIIWGSSYPISHYFITIFGVYYWLFLMVS